MWTMKINVFTIEKKEKTNNQTKTGWHHYWYLFSKQYKKEIII